MKKSAPLAKVSTLSNKGNYTLSLANITNIFNWLKPNTTKLVTVDLFTGFMLIYVLVLLAGLGRIVGVI